MNGPKAITVQGIPMPVYISCRYHVWDMRCQQTCPFKMQN